MMDNVIAIIAIFVIVLTLLAINLGDKQEGRIQMPEDCEIWFDGCNTCKRLNGDQLMCTGSFCAPEEMKEAKCLEFKE